MKLLVTRAKFVDLYRIVSFESFVNLCMQKKERFVNPIDCWEDTHEGYMLHKLDTRSGIEEVTKVLYNDFFDHDIDLTVSNLVKLQRARFTCYGQCWSQLKDSDALWRIYSYNRHAVQIRSSSLDIKKMINEKHKDIVSVRVGKVYYGNDYKDLSKILYSGSKTDAPFFYKRKEFQHEKEYRVMLQLTNERKEYYKLASMIIRNNAKRVKTSDDVQGIVDSAMDLMEKHGFNFYRSSFPKELFVDIDNIANYVLGVRVHPQAEAWYVELIKTICNANGLLFEGQSELYRDIK
ncbi:hypothetical protein [Butyrivibrio sp. AE2032]|uniref:hypothetical protein n=1 Tax=Butyrivibrio sp. AE2032 TaxID=1458463 RepID=UPI000557BDA3|nr:hypothetical protein [Butyrivibrio sp. AE2032]